MRLPDRVLQVLLIAGTIVVSWLAMQLAHELGHVLHAWATGASVARVIVHPLQLSQTLLASNPRPGLVAWGGPIWGCLLPLALWAATRVVAPRWAFLARFFAGLCLVTNGAYLTAGAFYGGRYDDAAIILASGGARWPLVIFGLAATVAGLAVWHGLGPHFGLGRKRKPDRREPNVEGSTSPK
jgi:hypothetical protein